MPTATVPLKNITIPDRKNREKIDPDELKSLTATMKARGMLNPIIVRPIGFLGVPASNNKYELVAGERRLRGAELLGWTEIDVNIQESDDEKAAELRLIENTERVPLTAWEEADQILALDPSLPIEEIANRLGRTPQWVAVRRAIGKLIPKLKDLVRAQDWPMGHLPLLARIPTDQQPAILQAIHETQQTEWCNYEGPNKNTPLVPSHRELSDFLAEYMRVLSSAPWKLDDADLLPKAGACNVCPKRVSSQNLLFPDLADAKSDRCLDEGCWKAKQAALVAVNVEKLAKQGKPPVLIQGHEPVSEETKQTLGPATIHNAYDFVDCKAKAPGAVQAVVVSGSDAGKVKYVKPSAFREAIGSANGNGTHGKVDQETGERAEPTTEERQAALKLKRQCLAAEKWSEKLPSLKVKFTGVVDALVLFFGTEEKKNYRDDGAWKDFAKRKKTNLNEDGWAQLYPVFQERLHRNGPLTQGKFIWEEALGQANAIGLMTVLEHCWKEAVKEIPLPKVLASQGVKDETGVPK